jgi:5-methyltetrahydrofolate--homocysteine methyltransferase
MISPGDFERFVLPSLNRTAGHLDHSIYHWDGPGQIAHLDHLLSMPHLDGIQWVPGDGSAPVWDEKWFPLYEKIQAAGKILVLHGFYTVEDALKVIKNFSPKGLWMSAALSSGEEAEALLAEARA